MGGCSESQEACCSGHLPCVPCEPAGAGLQCWIRYEAAFALTTGVRGDFNLYRSMLWSLLCHMAEVQDSVYLIILQHMAAALAKMFCWI